MNVTGGNPAICVVMPVFNDWRALTLVISNLADAFRPSGTLLDIILVNDASTKTINSKLWVRNDLCNFRNYDS